MTENFLFKAMFISLAAHTAVLCVTYFSRINDPHYKAVHQNRVEISYRPAYKRNVDIREYPVKPSQRLDFRSNPNFFANGVIPVSLVKEKHTLPFGMIYESKPQHMRSLELSHKVSITPIKSEKINNPVYAAYQDMVHTRILEKVNEIYFKKYTQIEKETGIVYLTFLIDEHGDLVEAKIIPEKTNASDSLQSMAMESLNASSPFPPFLKGMNLSEYPLSIEIDYKVSDD